MVELGSWCIIFIRDVTKALFGSPACFIVSLLSQTEADELTLDRDIPEYRDKRCLCPYERIRKGGNFFTH